MRLIDVHEGETEEQAEARVTGEPRRAVELKMAPTAAERVGGYVDADHPQVDERQGWVIDSIEALDWALGRRAELEREQAENARIIQRQVDWLMARLEKLNANAQRGVDFFTRKISEYAEAHRTELLGKGKKKSRTLPHGVVGWRAKPAKAKQVDAEALLAWARALPIEEGWVRTKEEPAWDRIKEHVEKTGKDVPGVELQPESEELVIKPLTEN